MAYGIKNVLILWLSVRTQASTQRRNNVAPTLLRRYVFIGTTEMKVYGNGYTFRGGNAVQLFCLPSEKGSILKEKNLLPSILLE